VEAIEDSDCYAGWDQTRVSHIPQGASTPVVVTKSVEGACLYGDGQRSPAAVAV